MAAHMATGVMLGVLVLAVGASPSGSVAGGDAPEHGTGVDAYRDVTAPATSAVRNGSLFAVWWTDYCQFSCYSVWRGGPKSPFRRLKVRPEGTPVSRRTAVGWPMPAGDGASSCGASLRAVMSSDHLR